MSDIRITYLLISILAAVTLIPFIKLIKQERRDYFEPVVTAGIFFIFLFIIRAIFDLSYGSAFLPKRSFDESTMRAFNMALLYLIACYIIFLIGYYSNLGFIIARSMPKINKEWSDSKYQFFSVFILAVGLMCFMLQVKSFGGLKYFIANKTETLTAGGQGYLQIGVSLIPLLFAVAVTRTISTGRGKFFTFAVLLPLNLIIGFLSGSKAVFMMPILTIFLARNYLVKKIKLSALITFGLAVVIIFPVFNIYRHFKDVEDASSALQKIKKSYAASILAENFIRRFYGIDSLTYIIRDTPEVMDYQLGKTVAPIAVVWVPRQLWQDKPVISFAKIFGNTYFRKFFFGTGIASSPTILGEAYINWHLGGMLWLSLICGIFIKSMYEYFITLNSGAPAVAAYSIIYLYLVGFWEGDIAGTLTRFIAALLPALFVIALMNKKTKLS